MYAKTSHLSRAGTLSFSILVSLVFSDLFGRARPLDAPHVRSTAGPAAPPYL